MTKLTLCLWTVVAFAACLTSAAAVDPTELDRPIEWKTQFLNLVIRPDGSIVAFRDRRTDTDYADHAAVAKFAWLRKSGQRHVVSQAAYVDGKLRLSFGESGVSVVVAVALESRYVTFEVLSISDTSLDELVFVDVPLSVRGALTEEFQGCALALNLKTDVVDIPGPTRRLRAGCFPRPGFVGAKAAVLGCPRASLREVMKEIVRATQELPQTDRGGPWALDAPSNRGSYLIDYPGSISETNVHQWIRTARAIGARQIDLHTGHSLRFGDYAPDPQIYPRGFDSLKAVVDQLHAAGIQAGLHTYAFFVAKDSPWVTPVPDPRLGKDATFTLTSALAETNRSVPVAETTEAMSTLTGFQVRNSVTLQIDDELITYGGVRKVSPYGFTDCQRGVHGTKAARHGAGARVHHLKECFGLFTPDGDSTMFEEVAARTAEVYNRCGFDMIYLDALDGTDILGRWPNAWKYYAGKFVFSLCRSLQRPAIMEMSTFTHHLWFARSRIGAWDAPSKGYKRFIDQHVFDNRASQPNLLPANLGWWCVFDGSTKDRARTFPDDLEYILCKALAMDHSLSWLLGFEPAKFEQSHNAQRLGALANQYEELRMAHYFSPAVREKVSAPNRDFHLEPTPEGQWRFRPVNYAVHPVSLQEGASERWEVTNSFGPQPLRLRIEALLSLAPYDESPEVLAAFEAPEEFSLRESSTGVTSSWERVSAPARAGAASACFSARSEKPNPRCAWSMVGKPYASAVDLREKGFGVWIYGDGKGEVLNFQWRTPDHISVGLSEHYAVIDFTGWRYFEFVEAESARLMDYGWPYLYANPDQEFAGVDGYKHLNRVAATYWVDYGKLDSLRLWYNNLPPGKEVKCYLSPVKSLTHRKTEITNPVLAIGDRRLRFRGSIPSGAYLEFQSMTHCRVYDAAGERLSDIQPEGDVPRLAAGANLVQFSCATAPGVSARAIVTLISQDERCVGE